MSATWDSKSLKGTPVSADEVLIIDTEDSRNQKRATLTSLPAILHVQVRNSSGGSLVKGDIVFVSGYNIGQDLPEVEKADASSEATVPAIGMVSESIANNANGDVIVSGRISGLDTSSFSAGDDIYVSETAGEFSTKPTGNVLIQKIGTVLRSHASMGIVAINSKLATNGFLTRTGVAGITASTTQTQGQGALTNEINEVSTVANANDVVTLPSASAFIEILIINNGANALQIFPASGDDVGNGADTSTILASGSSIRFVAYDNTNWVVE